MTATDARRGALAARIARLTPEQRAELERRLPASGDSESAVISRTEDDGPVPLTHAERHFWRLRGLAPETAVATVAFAVRLEGDLRLDALRRAVHGVVRRHEILRTSFAEVDGEPYQTALPFEQVADEVFATVDGSHGSDGTRTGPDETGADEDGEVQAWLAAERCRTFDLAAGHVFRVRVWRRGPREHVLLWTMHHIVTDAWSFDLLVGEVLRRYAEVVAGAQDALPDPALRYRDYAVWQHALDDGPAFAYWRDQLAGAPAGLALPYDRPGTGAPLVPAGSSRRTVPAAVFARLRDLCEAERTTTFVGILAAFQTLLHRYTSAADLVVGVGLAGRSRPELHNVLGCFFHTVPLRGDLTGRPTFREVVRRVRTTIRELLDHQDIPFGRIATRLGVDQLPFDVMLGYDRRPASPPALVGLTVHLIEGPGGGTVHRPFKLVATESGDDLSLQLAYRVDQFCGATAQRLVDGFADLLASVTAAPDVPVASVGLLDAAARHRTLTEWADGGPTPAAADGLTLPQRVDAIARRQPGAAAVIAGDAVLTWAALAADANRFASYLAAIGVTARDRVGLRLGLGADLVIAIIGALKSGAVVVPLDPSDDALPAGEALAAAGVSHVVAAAPLASTIPASRGTGLAAQIHIDIADAGWRRASATDPAVLIRPGHAAFIVFTSGYAPRPVVIEHRHLIAQIDALSARFGLGAGTYRSTHPVSSPDGLTALLAALGNGGVLCAAPTDHSDYLWTSPRRMTATAAQVMIVGGAASDGPKPGGVTVVRHYGSAETLPGISAGPGGRPLPGRRVFVLDSFLQAVPVGVVGEVYVGGDLTARGYADRPALTATCFVADPFAVRPGARLHRTGDLGRYRADGTIEVIGRADTAVTVRGRPVDTTAVRALAMRAPEVADAHVAAAPGPDGAPTLVAYLAVPAGSARSADGGPGRDREYNAEPALAAFDAELPAHMRPDRIVVLDSLPLTGRGRVDSAALPAPLVGERGR
jgi:non-ribosomal peptide synthetase component F